ncbi:paraquat-inducible protein A [Thalassotalea fonticola]|uniref:Paraquat-inducible protein A n=1 Tax=Thalassotalea fonticola TaxID=3065649 RepID=A0ABZ0GRV5_9GAMM|nr:paraquat-inducible protein A [Colwelliaceae bacterium S1-1]
MNQKQFACYECDTLITITSINEGEVASCPRCHHHIVDKKYDSINRTLAISGTGLLLFIPATFFPLMSMQLLSVESSASLMSGISALWQTELYLVATLIFLFCVLAPLVKLSAAFFVTLGYKHKRHQHPFYKQLMLFYHHVDSWEMLEVFLIGILVSIIKLKDMADLSFNLGLLCFSAFMLCVLSLKVTLDKQMIWDDLDYEH